MRQLLSGCSVIFHESAHIVNAFMNDCMCSAAVLLLSEVETAAVSSANCEEKTKGVTGISLT